MLKRAALLLNILFSVNSFSEELPAIFVKPRYIIKKNTTSPSRGIYILENTQNDPTIVPKVKQKRTPANTAEVVTADIESSSGNKKTNEGVVESTGQTENMMNVVEKENPSIELLKGIKLLDDVENHKELKNVNLYVSSYLNYNNSSSVYSFRDHTSFYNGIELGGKVRFSDQLGVSAFYNFSLGADVDGDTLTHSKVFAKYNDMQSSIDFGFSSPAEFKGASPLRVRLLYRDRRMAVPADSLYRMSIKSTGLGVGIFTPVSDIENSLWDMEISFFPNLQHKEDGATSSASSGNHRQSSLTELGLIRRIFSRGSHELFMRFDVQFEKNYFDGAAGQVDPKTSATPSNVSVTNSNTKFSLGFSWGK